MSAFIARFFSDKFDSPSKCSLILLRKARKNKPRNYSDIALVKRFPLNVNFIFSKSVEGL